MNIRKSRLPEAISFEPVIKRICLLGHTSHNEENRKKKYLIYRVPKEIDCDLSKHELVGVEYGADIETVADAIIRVVTDDLSGNSEYAGCEVFAYAPEPMDESKRTQRYEYHVTGVVSPVSAKENILVNYGIVEREESCQTGV